MLRHTPHVVTLHFRGLRPFGVSPYWLGDPGRAYKTQKSHAHSGIPADSPVTPPKRSNSSHAVAPTTGFNPTWPADLATPSAPKNRKKPTRSATLMEFLPLRRMSPSESTPRRLATPTTFRPQGFSPSRRIPPRSDARPCFMPVTPMGFRSPGVFPHCQVLRLVTEELPSWRFSSALLSKLRNPGRPISATLHRGSPRHEPLPPSGPCSDSESVPPLDCYIRCERPIPS